MPYSQTGPVPTITKRGMNSLIEGPICFVTLAILSTLAFSIYIYICAIHLSRETMDLRPNSYASANDGGAESVMAVQTYKQRVGSEGKQHNNLTYQDLLKRKRRDFFSKS